MLVSVLLSVFNGAATVARAVESIQQQTFGDWELIAVDDGSTDESASILEGLAEHDARIRVMRNDRNRGLAASLNVAFRASQGALLARMDADDVSLPRRFAQEVAYLAAHPDIAVVGGAAEVIGGDGTIMQRPTQHAEMVAAIYARNPLIHPSVMMRREVLEQLGGYDESFRRAQDYDLWLRAHSRFRFANLDEAVIRYTLPAQSDWRSSGQAARAVWRAGLRDGVRWRGLYAAARHLAAYVRGRLESRPIRP